MSTLKKEEIQTLSATEFKQLWKELEEQNDREGANYIIRTRCETDLELFALLFFPHYCTHAFNEFHIDYLRWNATFERAFRRAVAAPRGSAKSTFATLIKPIHDVCYGFESFIVIFSNTESQALGKLKDIRSELLENDGLLEVYGKFFKTRRVAESSFTAYCNGNRTMFNAYGSGTEIRGIRYGAHRPSKIVCDDVEHSEEVYTEDVRQKYADWFKEVVSQIGDENTSIEFVGTVLHKKSLLMEVLKNPRYQSGLYKSVISWAHRTDLWARWRDIYSNLDNDHRKIDAKAFFEAHRAAMLEGTRVLWPDKQPYYDLMETKIEIGDRAFFKEKQNDPLSEDEALFSRFHWYAEVPEGFKILESGIVIPWSQLDGAVGAMDPATGQTVAKAGKKGDFSAIVTGYKDQRGRLFVHNDWTRRAKPTEFIQAMFELNDLFKYEKFGVETNLFRNLLVDNIKKELTRLEEERRAAKRPDWAIRMALYDIENVENKQKRIFKLEPRVTNGYILFNRTLSEEFKSQLESFPLGEHDDAPDALEMLDGMVNNRYKVSGTPIDPMKGR